MSTSSRGGDRGFGRLAKSPWKSGFLANSQRRLQRGKLPDSLRRLVVERLEDRTVLSALTGGANTSEVVDTSLTPAALAASLVGPGVEVSNVTFTGGSASTGSFDFADPAVVGFNQGIILSSGSAADVVGTNASDWTSTDFGLPGDANLDSLSGFTTYDAAVLEFDFVPTANQVVFQYTFASDEYPEWVNTPYNDVFAFYVNGTNYAEVRQIAGDPSAPFVPVAVNNINNSNPVQFPAPVPMRPDLFRANYFNPVGPSAIDLELDGVTSVLTFQAPVNPGVVNHMKLAIADASDGVYDSAVFIQSGSLVSNENPVADLSLSPSAGDGPLLVTAIVEGEDPNGASLTYSIDWGDGTVSTGDLDSPTDASEKTALVNHTYTTAGEYIVTLTVSNGDLSGTSIEDVNVLGTSVAPDTTITGMPADPSNDSTPTFSFSSTAAGSTFDYQLDGNAVVPASGSETLGPLTDGTHSLQVWATDALGNTDPTPASYTWTIDTVAPDTSITAQPADPSNSSTASVDVTATETGATFEYQLDGGGFVAGNSGDVFGPLADGLHTFEVRATDVSGNTDLTPASYTWMIDTAPKQATASIVADPQNASQSILKVMGTSQDDTLLVERLTKQTQIRDANSGTVLGIFSNSAFQRVVVDGLDGNDTITVDAKFAKPTELHGGAGNDNLSGGAASDLLFGDAGNDRLYGNAGNDTLLGGVGDDLLFGLAGNDVLDATEGGNDVLVGGSGDDRLTGGNDNGLLIGGAGADTLLGGSAGDILVAGTTSYDANGDALLSILAEWKRSDLTYQERIDHLTGTTPGGLNGSFFLKSGTVKKDTAADMLTGGDGEDWFWAVAIEVADRAAGERLN
jgi:Ca2+-binding RTX toxin-like protein